MCELTYLYLNGSKGILFEMVLGDSYSPNFSCACWARLRCREIPVVNKTVSRVLQDNLIVQAHLDTKSKYNNAITPSLRQTSRIFP